MFNFWKKTARPFAACPAIFDFPTKFTPRIESFGDVHCAIDFELANLSMVQVAGGYVAIDGGTNPESTRGIAAEWERLAGGPILALIYTHSHADHIGGADGFDLEHVPIWAHSRFRDELGNMQLLPNAFFTRSVKQSGSVLPIEIALSNGIGPALRTNGALLPPLHLPTHVFEQEQELEIGGRKFVLRWAPGETNDHLSVWLPDRRILFAGDNIYKSFPNLYTLRGSAPRPVQRWVDTLDEMRRQAPRPELLILGHTAPIQGADVIYQLLTEYRDAIAFVHDSVVRGINAGKSPHSLAREIRLPPHIANHPFLREHYGTVAGSIRGIYSSYMGWFDGDAANVDPPAEEELGAWLAEELGGRQELLKRIQRASDEGDVRRALWLSRLASAQLPDCSLGRAAKARALAQAAELCENPLVRNWQLSEAALLRNDCQLPKKPKVTGDTVERTPVEQLLRLLPSRLNPKTTSNVCMAIGFDITDIGRQFTFMIRRGVGELAPGIVGTPDLIVRATQRDMNRVFMGGSAGPMQAEFWKALEFAVPDQGVLTPVHRLYQLARLSRLFLRP